MSEWRQIEDLPYSVNTDGCVRNDRTGYILKPVIVSGGYMEVRLWQDNKVYNRLVHRLVASAFLSNLDDKKEVNHKDGDKSNNKLNNLEWVTRSENQWHRYNILNHRGHNPSTVDAYSACMKKVICIETGEIYKSITSAAKTYGGTQSSLSKHLLGYSKTFANLHWRYC